MKQDNRNCNMPYFMYPNMPMMPYQQMGYQGPIPFTSNNPSDYMEQINNLEKKINILDQRVTNLEKSVINNNNYSSSNYQMM